MYKVNRIRIIFVIIFIILFCETIAESSKSEQFAKNFAQFANQFFCFSFPARPPAASSSGIRRTRRSPFLLRFQMDKTPSTGMINL